ncbi:hypothetical protein E2C01_094028 [Portunus trituberculatus]|uniref:Uncharacterized protein n=1 Tax=Portunus trituberculatus TaxID=210409 RepID=A0A5B7JPC5_PORTR|nr:hypothetical protein [Portunus trituberculatus]
MTHLTLASLTPRNTPFYHHPVHPPQYPPLSSSLRLHCPNPLITHCCSFTPHLPPSRSPPVPSLPSITTGGRFLAGRTSIRQDLPFCTPVRLD